MHLKYYIGVNLTDAGQRWRVFTAKTEPNHQTHGATFIYVIGPFPSRSTAAIMAHFGKGNPHLQTVSQAVRMAKKRPEMVKEALAKVEFFN